MDVWEVQRDIAQWNYSTCGLYFLFLATLDEFETEALEDTFAETFIPAQTIFNPGITSCPTVQQNQLLFLFHRTGKTSERKSNVKFFSNGVSVHKVTFIRGFIVVPNTAQLFLSPFVILKL